MLIKDKTSKSLLRASPHDEAHRPVKEGCRGSAGAKLYEAAGIVPGMPGTDKINSKRAAAPV